MLGDQIALQDGYNENYAFGATAADLPGRLGAGYMVAISSLTTLMTDCNPLLSAETLMMVKEHIVDDYGVIAHTIGMEEEAIEQVVKAGDLHDIGKLGIPDEILSRPGPLNDEQWEFMRRHTLMGEQIIAAAGPSLEQIAPLVRSSHERWDGTGYPDRLAGEEIPLGARIITICDSFRAMIDERVYKPAMSVEEALPELRRCAGTQFDPHLVEVFCRLVTQRMARERVGSAA